MGKTLKNYFCEAGGIVVHQFFIHSEVPVDDAVCSDYFRFTDSDALKSRLQFRERGTIFDHRDIRSSLEFSRTDRGTVGKLYQYGRKRTPAIYILRNLVWKTARWNTRKLRDWIQSASPDVVFFAAGDYAFAYEIAKKIADYADCALVVLCTDNFIPNEEKQKKNTSAEIWPKRLKTAFDGPLLKKLSERQFIKTVYATMGRTECILCMCDEMRDWYRNLFSKTAYTVYTGAEERAFPTVNKKKHVISYVGYLGGNRHKSLIELGEAISKLDLLGGPDAIEVYSNEKRPQIVEELRKSKGIRFHGEASSEKASEVIADSEFVVHVEGFDTESRKKVRYSVSTKIADYLMNGPCIIAYGPGEVASMRYLSDNGAGFTITSKEMLSEKLREIFSDPQKSVDIVNNARLVAHRNHETKKVGERLSKLLGCAAANYSEMRGGCR